jgi:hypothetical protein
MCLVCLDKPGALINTLTHSTPALKIYATCLRSLVDPPFKLFLIPICPVRFGMSAQLQKSDVAPQPPRGRFQARHHARRAWHALGRPARAPIAVWPTPPCLGPPRAAEWGVCGAWGPRMHVLACFGP